MKDIVVHKYIKVNTSNNIIIERIVAELYLLSLPFRQIKKLTFLSSIVGACAEWLPFLFHCIGLILWAFSDAGQLRIDVKKRKLINSAFLLMVYLNISSIIMAGIIQSTYGNQGTENAFQGIIGMCLYFTQYFFMFIYSYRVFKILDVARIETIIGWCCRLLLFIALLQILVMNGIGAQIYDKINFLGILSDSGHLPKLRLTGTEGASAGGIIAIFVLPFLFSKVIMGKKKYIVELLLWLVPIYYTYSTTAYLLVVTSIITFILLFITHTHDLAKGIKTLFIISIVIVMIFVILTNTGILGEQQTNKIEYLLLEKAVDMDNGSTVSRTIPLYVNWGAFTEYPILGVGNGLQGYFYEKYFPQWAFSAKGSDADVYLDRSRQGISNGGLFFPGLLSGYGIVGCILILVFIWRCFQENKNTKAYSGLFYYSCIIAFISFIVMGFQGDAYGQYYAWFMISIPFMTKKENISN